MYVKFDKISCNYLVPFSSSRFDLKSYYNKGDTSAFRVKASYCSLVGVMIPPGTFKWAGMKGWPAKEDSNAEVYSGKGRMVRNER